MKQAQYDPHFMQENMSRRETSDLLGSRECTVDPGLRHVPLCPHSLWGNLNLFNKATPGDLDKIILEKIMTKKKSGDDRKENDDIDDDTMQ